MDKNIVLIGLMGSGKTTLGKLIATESGMKFVDTDELIVERAGKSINKIFEEDGEECFRDLETEVILEVSRGSAQVISTGGGAVLRDENVDALRQNGVLFYLEASPEVLWERVKDDDSRPLLKCDDPIGVLRQVLTDRKPFYEQADFTVNTGDITLEEAVKQVLLFYSKTSA